MKERGWLEVTEDVPKEVGTGELPTVMQTRGGWMWRQPPAAVRGSYIPSLFLC